MKEAGVTSKLHAHLKSVLHHWDIYKVCDRITKGRPDSQFTGQGYTTYVEVKLLKRGKQLRGCSEPLQLDKMNHLWHVTRHRAWYAIYDQRNPKAKQLLLISPPALLQHTAGGSISAVPWVASRRLADQIIEAGAVGIPGFAHGAVAQLLLETHV